jgi:hypothetical protein
MNALQQISRRDEALADHRSAATLLGAGAILGADRVRAGRSARRAAARPDEDAVTLSTEAAARALAPDVGRVGGILLATTTPPYLEGASVQALAELLGLQGDVFALELSASLRDGLAAVRIAAALAPSLGPVLVCAAHAGGGDPTLGDGAVALLLGDGEDAHGGEGLGRLTPAASSAIEMRDRWRLHGDPHPRDADRSFVQAIGTDRLVRDLLAEVPEQLAAPPLVVGPDSRGSAKLERSLDGPDDTVTRHTGVIGAAHPLLRLLAGLDSPTLVLAMSNGLGEALHVLPAPAAAAVAEDVRELAEHGGSEADRVMVDPTVADFDPYASGPRSWRDRDIDLRLHGLVGPPEGLSPVPGRRHPEGVVIARTEDHVYPAAKVTELATVTMDDGGQFYGQVAIGEHVAIGDRVKLVPRKLHHGAGMVQYFWKVMSCR